MSTETARTERLDLLRAQKESTYHTNQYHVIESAKPLVFRNYTPMSEEVKEMSTISTANDSASIREEIQKVEDSVKRFASDAIENETMKSTEIDIISLAPKKPNWDLKRELDRKMEGLNAKTNQAIADIVRERLRKEKNIADVGASNQAFKD